MAPASAAACPCRERLPAEPPGSQPAAPGCGTAGGEQQRGGELRGRPRGLRKDAGAGVGRHDDRGVTPTGSWRAARPRRNREHRPGAATTANTQRIRVWVALHPLKRAQRVVITGTETRTAARARQDKATQYLARSAGRGRIHRVVLTDQAPQLARILVDHRLPKVVAPSRPVPVQAHAELVSAIPLVLKRTEHLVFRSLSHPVPPVGTLGAGRQMQQDTRSGITSRAARGARAGIIRKGRPGGLPVTTKAEPGEAVLRRRGRKRWPGRAATSGTL